MTKDTNAHSENSEHVDLVGEATAQAAAGATTDVHDSATYGNSDVTDGRVPDPDLAQGESD
jgi:hypothetical protein